MKTQFSKAVIVPYIIFSQSEFGEVLSAPTSLNLLKRATDRAEILDGILVSSQSSNSDDYGGLATFAAVVVVFGHGWQHTPPNISEAAVRAAITKNLSEK